VRLRGELRRRFHRDRGLASISKWIGVALELNPIEIEGAVANRAGHANPFGAPAGEKFNLKLRADWQVGDGKEAHPNLAEIYAEGIHLRGFGEYLHGHVQQLASAATPVISWAGFESQLQHD
jgi:hypothetical protein